MLHRLKNSKIARNFIYLDFIGPVCGFEDNDSLRFKSLAGAILSSIIVISITILSYFFGKEIYEKNNPSISINHRFLNLSLIHLYEFPVIFEFKTYNGTSIDDYTKYLELVTINHTMNEDNIISKTYNNHGLIDCNNKSFHNNSSDVQDLIEQALLVTKTSGKTFYCLDFDSKSHFQNEDYTQNSSSYNVGFRSCLRNTGLNSSVTTEFDGVTDLYCKGIIEKSNVDDDHNNNNDNKEEESESIIKIDDIVLTFYYINSYVDYNNITKPIQYYWETINHELNSAMFQKNYIKLVINELTSDLGWLLEQNHIFNYIQLESRIPNDMNVPVKGENKDLLYLMTLESPRFHSVIKRQYMKIQDLFARIGGLMNALLIIIKVASYHYLRFLYIYHVRDITKETVEEKRFAYKPGMFSFCVEENSSIRYNNTNNDNISEEDQSNNKNKNISSHDKKINDYNYTNIADNHESPYQNQNNHNPDYAYDSIKSNYQKPNNNRFDSNGENKGIRKSNRSNPYWKDLLKHNFSMNNNRNKYRNKDVNNNNKENNNIGFNSIKTNAFKIDSIDVFDEIDSKYSSKQGRNDKKLNHQYNNNANNVFSNNSLSTIKQYTLTKDGKVYSDNEENERQNTDRKYLNSNNNNNSLIKRNNTYDTYSCDIKLKRNIDNDDINDEKDNIDKEYDGVDKLPISQLDISFEIQEENTPIGELNNITTTIKNSSENVNNLIKAKKNNIKEVKKIKQRKNKSSVNISKHNIENIFDSIKVYNNDNDIINKFSKNTKYIRNSGNNKEENNHKRNVKSRSKSRPKTRPKSKFLNSNINKDKEVYNVNDVNNINNINYINDINILIPTHVKSTSSIFNNYIKSSNQNQTNANIDEIIGNKRSKQNKQNSKYKIDPEPQNKTKASALKFIKDAKEIETSKSNSNNFNNTEYDGLYENNVNNNSKFNKYLKSKITSETKIAIKKPIKNTLTKSKTFTKTKFGYFNYLYSIFCCNKPLRLKYESQMMIVKHSISFKLITNLLMGFILEETSLIGDSSKIDKTK